jgi:hypothetical protein
VRGTLRQFVVADPEIFLPLARSCSMTAFWCFATRAIIAKP